jgi:hypothetical protein
MTIVEKIKALYPQIEDDAFVSLIIVQDDSDGKGPYLKEWAYPGIPRPTDKQLEGVGK